MEKPQDCPPSHWYPIIEEKARFMFSSFPDLKLYGYTWEDISQEVFIIVSTKVDCQKVHAPKAFIEVITRRLCSALLRQERAMQLLNDDTNSHLLSVIDHYIQKLTCPCRVILNNWYMEIPPVRNADHIVTIVEQQCGKTYKPEALHVKRSECTKDLRKLISDDPDGLFLN